ncbi:hypothetical protein [Bacillus massiliigorillae]|uniref:hypothetical protein n=1 Tax=Bacillus massiliigorillae TaxID=1243664 RepID=UPI00039C8CA1|nr:hypothetical protein [Bacillus massiliigorillae]
MTKKFFYVLLIVFCIFLPSTKFSDAYRSKSNVKTIEEISCSILDNDYPLRIIDNPKITIKNSNILLHFDIDKEFESVNDFNKFTSFDYFSKKLRYQLFTNHNKTTLYNHDFTFIANTKKDSYEYTNKLPNEQLVFKTRSQLIMNNEIIYTSNEFKKKFNEIASLFPREKINGYDDFEIFMYGYEFFNTMTKRGRYYDPETDNNLVVKAVKDKFGITTEEYEKIYEKYYLLY